MQTQQTTRQNARPSTSKIWRFNGVAAAVAVALGGLAAVPGQAFAAAPAALSTIGNTASATYTDASAVSRTATSNTVQTIVQQVGSFTLTANNNKIVAPGGQVVYSHTLTNTGNGSDTYTLSTAQTASPTDQFDLTGFTIYADADGNGVADNAIPVSTVTLASGGIYKFVIVGNAPGTTVATDTSIATITATSGFNAGTANNTDTATVTADAVITVTKSANVITGPTGTVVQYTLTYTNTGNNTATNVVITDAIPKDASFATIGGMKYQASSGIWSAGGTLTDTAGGADDGAAGINYSVTGTPIAGDETVNVTIASVAPNVSGTIKFSVVVDNDATGVDGNSIARPGVLTNTANYVYNNGTSGVPSQPTNSVNFLVTQTAAVAANDSNTGNALDGSNGTDPSDASTGNDIVVVASATQGSTVVFDNYIWNNGNGTDKFNITYANAGVAGFPAGTSFQLFQADGVNVLQDTNSDGIPDTGSLAPGASYKVVLKATLPANATGGPFNVIKRATSVIDPTKTDTVTDQLTAVTVNVVDLSNNITTGQTTLGAGAGATAGAEDNGGAGWSTATINPGTSTTFRLMIENKVGSADNYNLAADSDNGFAPLNLPAGWTVTFRNDGGAGNCSTVGATITNTGTINAGAGLLVCAVVSVPVTQAPITDQDIYFRALSPVTGAVDTKLDTVTVNTVRNLQMTTDNTGQVFPGGSVVYTHLVTNNGNVTEGDDLGELVFSASNTLSGTGFSTVFYIDTNNDGTLDAGDQAITAANFHTLSAGTTGYVGAGANTAGLVATETIRIFAKVQAPAGATPGTTDSATITATLVGPVNLVAAPAAAVNTDTTNVIGGQIRLDKTQALDAACDGTADAAFAASTINALPGACIMYSILATNEGVSPVTAITINDATPAFTSLEVAPSAAPAISVALPSVGATTGISTDGATGALGATINTLSGGQTATFTFSVKIDQ